MRLVLVGPPGCGKGTQAQLLVERLNLRYIGTGEMLREAIRQRTPTGLQAIPYMERGELVPDSLVNGVVALFFQGDEKPTRFVLDGYPRTEAQAIWFNGFMHEHGQDLDAVIQLAVSDDEVVRRNSSRRVCPICQTSYNLVSRPPKVAGICDREQAALIQRPDDYEETIRNRLRVFHSTADQLVAYYRAAGLLREISTNAPIESIYQNIISSLPPNK
jgi:adenylate kinase